MEVLGYIVAGLIGVSLGLIGAGGSVLTVPVMVYFFAVEPVQATSYSLFVVGCASAIGAYSNYRKGLVRTRTALLIGSFSIATVFITRKFVIPHIPETLGRVNGFVVTESFTIMMLFALLMLFVSVSMIRGSHGVAEAVRIPPAGQVFRLSVYGVAIGFITGLLGVGGGFLLIPALVLFVGLPMKEAVGTSLFIIALNSLIGFVGDIGHFTMDWILLTKITVLAVAGIIAGHAMSKKIDADKLKKVFGWFVMIMALSIVAKEIFMYRRINS